MQEAKRVREDSTVILNSREQVVVARYDHTVTESKKKMPQKQRNRNTTV